MSNNPFGEPKCKLYFGQDNQPNPYRNIIKLAKNEKSYAQNCSNKIIERIYWIGSIVIISMFVSLVIWIHQSTQ